LDTFRQGACLLYATSSHSGDIPGIWKRCARVQDLVFASVGQYCTVNVNLAPELFSGHM